MTLHALKYLGVYVTPSIVAFSLLAQGYWTYSAMVLIFGIIPLLELLMRPSTQNLSPEEEEAAKKNPVYDYILYSLLPIQYILLGLFLVRVQQEGLPGYVYGGWITAFGLSCGVLGINAAHELGHRHTRYEQWMSKMLLLSSLYMHFFIEHNRGHHRHVATDEDPASARRGETVYAFYLRSVWGSWLSAWRLEAERLQKAGLSRFSWHNEMLRFQAYQVGLLLGIGLLFGLWPLACFVMAATMGFLLLETVNYIEHYGLRRSRKGARYERPLPVHSWNSNHPVGRLLLLELSRHSDHHYIASRKYQLLRHFDHSPQMPTGYPGMMLLAFVPPLWFWLMHKRIEQIQFKMN